MVVLSMTNVIIFFPYAYQESENLTKTKSESLSGLVAIIDFVSKVFSFKHYTHNYKLMKANQQYKTEMNKAMLKLHESC